MPGLVRLSRLASKPLRLSTLSVEINQKDWLPGVFLGTRPNTGLAWEFKRGLAVPFAASHVELNGGVTLPSSINSCVMHCFDGEIEREREIEKDIYRDI